MPLTPRLKAAMTLSMQHNQDPSSLEPQPARRRLALAPLLLVIAACAMMIGLGVWQLARAESKEALLARYASAAGQPPVAWPAVPDRDALPLFRRTQGMCLEVTGWRATSGRNVRGESGWSHIAACRTGVEGPGMQVDAGWSRSPANPVWVGGLVRGTIAPDGVALLRLVSAVPLAPGLVASAPPSPETIPNNHRGYAIQWFLFATVAAVIYLIALRRRA